MKQTNKEGMTIRNLGHTLSKEIQKKEFRRTARVGVRHGVELGFGVEDRISVSINAPCTAVRYDV